MEWDELEAPSDADIQSLFARQNMKRGFFGGSNEKNTLSLSIHGGTIGDASLALIAQFPDLKNLSIYNDNGTFHIDGSGIAMLPACKTLQKLSLVGIPLKIDDV